MNYSSKSVLSMSDEQREVIEELVARMMRTAWEGADTIAEVQHNLVLAILPAILRPSIQAFQNIEWAALRSVDCGLHFGMLFGFYAALTMEAGQDPDLWFARASEAAGVVLDEMPEDVRNDAARFALEHLLPV